MCPHHMNRFLTMRKYACLQLEFLSQPQLLPSLSACRAVRAGAGLQGIREARCSVGGPCPRAIVSNEWGLQAHAPRGSPKSARQGTRTGAAGGAQGCGPNPEPGANQVGSPLKRVCTPADWPGSAPAQAPDPDPNPGHGLEIPSPAGASANGRVKPLARTPGEGALQDQHDGLVAARGEQGLQCRVKGLPPGQGCAGKGEGLCGMSPSGSGAEDSLLHCLLQGASSPLSTLSKDPQVRHTCACRSCPSKYSSAHDKTLWPMCTYQYKGLRVGPKP